MEKWARTTSELIASEILKEWLIYEDPQDDLNLALGANQPVSKERLVRLIEGVLEREGRQSKKIQIGFWRLRCGSLAFVGREIELEAYRWEGIILGKERERNVPYGETASWTEKGEFFEREENRLDLMEFIGLAYPGMSEYE